MIGESMDIQKELQMFQELGYNSLREKLNEQQEELRKKQYLFKVINILEKFDKAIKSEFFIKNQNKFLFLKQDYDYDIGEIFSKVDLLDENKKSQTKYNHDGNFFSDIEFITKLLGQHNFILEDSLFNEEIIKKTIIIELDKTACEKLKNYLFNEELKIVLDYMEISKGLQKKKKSKQQKI
jgi:hypothetical protein